MLEKTPGQRLAEQGAHPHPPQPLARTWALEGASWALSFLVRTGNGIHSGDIYRKMPGSSPGGSRDLEGWTALAWKDLFIY